MNLAEEFGAPRREGTARELMVSHFAFSLKPLFQGPGTHLGLPDGVHSVANDFGSPLLSVVGEGRKDAVLPRLNRNLQVRVWVEKHPFLQPHGLEIYKIKDSLILCVLARLKIICPWNSPGKNTGAGSHSLLQEIFLTQGSNPGLLHCRQILYRLSHQGRPERL